MFQKSIIEKYLSKLDENLLHEKYEKYCANYKNETKIANIRAVKEEQYQEGFIRDVFCSVLNYTIKPEPDYNILTELKNETKNKNNARKSDGAICEENNESRVRAVIELKGTDTTDLDTVARQAFDYKSHHENCNYAVVCNFERLRLYVETQIEFIEFNLFTLTFEDFCILYLLLELNQLKNDIPLKLKHETLSEEKQITDNFYADYSTFKRSLFEDMIEKNPQTDKLVLFKKTQKILDRILFILFCEDRGLLPANSVMGIIGDYQKLKEMGYGQPLYSVFKTYFDRIDKGYKSESDSSKNIFAYNGGLFKPDETLDNLTVGDDVLFIHSKRLADYDFESQISVDILGRIFENSLTEIEEVQKEIEAEKSGEKVEINNIGKRKKDGVFYTPEYITKYIVENTIGKLCEQQRAKLNISDEEVAKAQTKKQKDTLNAALHEYQKWLFSLKILDPACGSGAFLTAALTQLKAEHRRVFDFLHAINNDSMMFEEYSDNSILENNLYGVDINEESVEITKLSLWLHTAQKDRKLTTLNGKIKCGNSLIDDSAIAGEKAFNWEKEFPEVFGGNSRGKGLKSLVQSTLSTVNDIEKGDVIYHVTTATHNSRYSEKALFFNDGAIGKPVNLDFDEEIFVMQTIAKIIAENKYKVLAYNFCKDHLHFLVACKKEELPKIMQKIKGITSLERNRKFNPTDRQLWQQKYFEKVVYNDEYLENTIHYILNNRKKHGLKEFTDDDGGNIWGKGQTDGGNSRDKGLKSLEKGENKHGFDVVIGNPPYVNMVNILNENERRFYQANYKTAKGMCDLYSIFTEKAHYILKKNGLFGFIFSNSWMGINAFSTFREFLLKNVKIFKITELPEKVFRDATVKTCICLYINTNTDENNTIEIEKCENEIFSSKGFELSYKQILDTADFNFVLEKTVELNKVQSIKLGSIIDFTSGIKTANDDKFVFTEKKNDECFLFLRGRNVKRYGKAENNEYMWYSPDLMLENNNARPRIFENFTVEKKIIIQQVAQQITATIDKNKYLCNVSLNVIFNTKQNYSMEYILVLLNSNAVNYWFKKTFPTGLHFTLNQLEVIPVPELTLEAQQPFINLADKMLALNESLQKSVNRFLNRIKDNLQVPKITASLEKFYELEFAGFVKELGKQKIKLSLKQQDEWEEYFSEYKTEIAALSTQIDSTDKEINALVYQLYGLTDEEIAVVEGK